MYIDQNEFESKFLLTPNIDELEDYNHLDKNLATSNLKSQFREPEQARNILSALHTLSNKKYFKEVKETIIKGYTVSEEERLTSEGETIMVTIRKPVVEEIIRYVNRYPKTYHRLKAKFYSFTTTSAARGGHLIKMSRTQNKRMEQTLDDKTNNKTSFGFFKNEKREKEGEW